eukprot:Gb_32631 [translate_table: standard]
MAASSTLTVRHGIRLGTGIPFQQCISTHNFDNQFVRWKCNFWPRPLRLRAVPARSRFQVAASRENKSASRARRASAKTKDNSRALMLNVILDLAFGTFTLPILVLFQTYEGLLDIEALLLEIFHPLTCRNASLTKQTYKEGRCNNISSVHAEKVQQDEGDEDSLGEDALEALFSMLEKDLELGEVVGDNGDDVITDEEAARFEEELQAALSDLEDDDEAQTRQRNTYDDKHLSDVPSDDDQEIADIGTLLAKEREDLISKLENWQLQKLAAALELGRRKISVSFKPEVKSLAVDLGLDRGLVLDLLRDPPPKLLLVDGFMPEKDNVGSSGSKSKPLETASPTLAEVEQTNIKTEDPVYVTQMGWNRKKRMKKVHIATLEKVYRRTKRPTVSISHLL